MKHLKLFKTNVDFESATLELPNISFVEEAGSVFYKPFIDYSKEYLTIEAIDECTFQWNDIDCEYSLDNGNTWISQPAGMTFTINANSEIKFKATWNNDSIGSLRQYRSGKCNIKGNIMSLLYGDDFVGKTDLSGKDYVFVGLFSNCKFIDASNLVLPATTLAEHCYDSMFWKCTSLTTSPLLPATTLASACYAYMFEECSSLNEITMLATDISAYDCLTDWVTGVASSGTFIKHPDMNDLSIDTSGIPEGWTVEDYQE